VPHAVVVPRWTGNASVPHASRASDSIEHVAEDLFVVSQRSSPLCNVFSDIGFGVLHCCPSGCCEHTVDDVEGRSGLSAQECTSTAAMMWSSTLVLDCRCGGSEGSTSDSIVWAGSSVPWSIHICETSWTVSEVAQKKAGLSFQPICKALGTTTLSSSPGLEGMTYAKFQRSSLVTIIRQYPSARSNFEKWMCFRPPGLLL
jgi:hypothetical protein